MKCGVLLRRNSTVSRARCAGALSCWKTNTSPTMLQIAVAASASATCLYQLPVDVCSRLNEDEVGTAVAATIARISSTNPSFGSVLLQHGLNFSRAWWNATLASVRWKSSAFHKVVRWHFSGVMVKGQQFVFFWDNVNNMKYAWIKLLKNDFLDFPSYSGYNIQARWANVQANDVKFSQDLIH